MIGEVSVNVIEAVHRGLQDGQDDPAQDDAVRQLLRAEDYAIATALGSFSIVVPDFARAPFRLESCATYRLTAASAWRPGGRPKWVAVPSGRAAAMFQIVGD